MDSGQGWHDVHSKPSSPYPLGVGEGRNAISAAAALWEGCSLGVTGASWSQPQLYLARPAKSETGDVITGKVCGSHIGDQHLLRLLEPEIV